jgi:O-antigen ligase
MRDKKNIYDILFVLLLISFPFSKAAPNIILGILAVFFLIDKPFQSLKSVFKTPFLALLLCFVYLILDTSFQGNAVLDFKYFKTLAIFIVVPLLYQKVTQKKWIFIAIISSAFLAFLFSCFKILKFYIDNHGFSFSNGPFVNEILVFERPYLGFLINLGICCALYLAKKYARYKIPLYTGVMIMVFFIFFIAARMSFLSLMIFAFVYFIFYTPLHWLKKTGIISCTLLVFVVLIFSISSIRERFYLEKDFNETIKSVSDYEPRLIIWPCAYEISKNDDFNAIYGLGSATLLEKKLVGCYNQKIPVSSKKDWFLQSAFNTHNQFIDFYMMGGIIALVLFLLFLSLTARKIYQDPFLFSIFFLTGCFFFVENVFHRQLGCYISGLVFGILLFFEQDVENETIID